MVAAMAYTARDANEILQSEGPGGLRGAFDTAMRETPGVANAANTVLEMMDQGLNDDEIRACLGNIPEIQRLRRQWEGEARRSHAHARTAAGVSPCTNEIDGAAL